MGILWKSNGIIIWNFEDQVQSNPMRMLSKSNGYQWDFFWSNPIKSYENLIKISWWPWDLSDQFPSNPMRILSKSHEDPWDLSDQIPSNPMRILSKPNGYHGICQIKSHQIQWESLGNLMDTNRIFHFESHQIQWESYQNLMDTMGFVRSNPIKSKKNLFKI